MTTTWRIRTWSRRWIYPYQTTWYLCGILMGANARIPGSLQTTASSTARMRRWSMGLCSTTRRSICVRLWRSVWMGLRIWLICRISRIMSAASSTSWTKNRNWLIQTRQRGAKKRWPSGNRRWSESIAFRLNRRPYFPSATLLRSLCRKSNRKKKSWRSQSHVPASANNNKTSCKKRSKSAA